MDIKALLGDGYKEDMTAEELIAALNGVELPTDQQLRESVNRATKENAAKKRELREKDGAIEDLQRQVAALQRESAINKHAASFVAMGYDKDAAMASAIALADGDASTLMEQHGRFLQSLRAQLKTDLMKRTPAPAMDTGDAPAGDYRAKAQSAQTAGDYLAAAYYTRLAEQQATE